MSIHQTEIIKDQSNCRGFSILEVVVALGLLAVGILAVGIMQLTAVRGNALARDITILAAKAEERVERLIGLPYGHSSLNVLSNNASHSEDNGNIQWTVVDNTPFDKTKTITLTATKSGFGGLKSFTIQSIKALRE